VPQLRGMTWDHIRGYGPLLETTLQFQCIHPDFSIRWERRSLKDFGDYPVDQLASEYDIIMIDHPHVGICAEQEVLVPLDQWLDDEILEDQTKHSVGPSFLSYQWRDHTWALPVDAAAQVTAYRPDLMNGLPLPSTWQQVLELPAHLPPAVKIGMPLCPTDLMCSFLSICANIGGGQFFDGIRGIHPEIGEQAVSLLQKLLPILHPKSLEWNPIQMLNHMADTNEIALIPLCFGYSNYSRAETSANLICFANIPSFNGVPHGSLLGGVGLAISASSRHIQAAVKYAEYTASGAVQRTIYFDSGGQPGHRSAWDDPEVNKKCHSFFANTITTLELAYVRPRDKHFPAFQEKAGEYLHKMLAAGRNAKEIVTEINHLYSSVHRKFHKKR